MKSINSDKAPEPVGAYPHAKRVGNFLYLSGIGPRNRGTKVIPGVTLDESGNLISHDIRLQCESVFENVKLVLEDAGASLRNLVDITVFLTNMKEDFKTYNEMYADFFAEYGPTRTTIEIKSLPTPIAIELKCVAYLENE